MFPSAEMTAGNFTRAICAVLPCPCGNTFPRYCGHTPVALAAASFCRHSGHAPSVIPEGRPAPTFLPHSPVIPEGYHPEFVVSHERDPV